MSEILFAITKGLVIVTLVAPFVIGWPFLLGGIAHDEWHKYQHASRGTKNENLVDVIICGWLLIVTAVGYAALAMKLWEEWRCWTT